MNKQNYDILEAVLKESYMNQRSISETTGFSLGKVNRVLKELQEEGYLSSDMQPTEKCKEEISAKKPRNAIILAAGIGMRMVPINTMMPKGLLEVRGEVLIERVLRQLQEAGISDISIVVGFMKEQYEYLVDKYNIKLVVNPEYAEKNNLHSLALLCDEISNSYIIPSDIWCEENPFSVREWYSWYMVTKDADKNSFVRINRKHELVETDSYSETSRMIGISYILESEAEYLRNEMQRKVKSGRYDKEFWETSLLRDGKMTVSAKIVSAQKVFEINTYEQLREVDATSGSLDSDVLKVISSALQVSNGDITEIKVLKKGMTNRSFQFSCRGKSYIMRVPGEGTDNMINRSQEYEVYQAIKDKNIADPIVYISPDTGYKITGFLEGARVCNIDDTEDLKLCMKKLKEFHQSRLQVEHTFDIWERLEYYESLWNIKESMYRDYRETKEKVFRLKRYVDRLEKDWTLTHIDAVPDNFLICGGDVKLIDWEYAGMQDPHVDIAMFCIYAMYEREQVDRLIDIYFEGRAERTVRIKIYCYIAMCGLLWSNWCEYKYQLGVEFGEYSLRQYRFAKDYYKIAVKEIGKLEEQKDE